MIITRSRSEELARCFAALSRVAVPADAALSLFVVDNATPPEEERIRRQAGEAGLDVAYAHEPVRGYASPRNRALGLALAAECDILIFIDDDVSPEPDFITAHLAGLAQSGADVSMGGQTGRDIGQGRRFRKMKVATLNVAFRRHLVEPAPGLALRFDSRLDLTGYEDHEFFFAAQERGARVIRNGAARVALADSRASITQRSMTDEQVAVYLYATGRNLAYVRRIRHGRLAAWATAVYMIATFAGRSLVNGPASIALRPLSPRLAAKARRSSIQDGAFMRGLAAGLVRPGVERSAAKRGEIIEIRDGA